MTTQLQRYTETTLDSFQVLEKMAKAFANSKLFGIQNKDQALALMLLAHSEGVHPASAARDYNIVQGRPAKKSEAILRDFFVAGGRVEWHDTNDKVAEATFSHEQGGSVRIKWDMAKASATGLSNKDNWKKYPAAMLRARLVSEGVRAVYPGATGGLYTPEEVNDFPPQTRVVREIKKGVSGLQKLPDFKEPLDSSTEGDPAPLIEALPASLEKEEETKSKAGFSPSIEHARESVYILLNKALGLGLGTPVTICKAAFGEESEGLSSLDTEDITTLRHAYKVIQHMIKESQI